MDDLHNGPDASSVVNRLEDILREQFTERERKWNEQDARRHELRMKHKERILKRLELQRRAGQMYTTEQVELATAAATSQDMLPSIVRRSLRNGEYAYHGKNCSVQELRHCGCKLGSRLLEEAQECTHRPIPSWELDKYAPLGTGISMSQSSVSDKRHISLNIDGFPIEERSISGPVHRSQSRAAFNTLISANDKPLESKANYSLDNISRGNAFRIDMLSGLSMQLFDPEDMQCLLETEKKDGTGRRLEEGLLFKSVLEKGEFNSTRLQSGCSCRSASVIHPDTPTKSMPISFFDSFSITQQSSLSTSSKPPLTACSELESVSPLDHTDSINRLDLKSANTDVQRSLQIGPTVSTFTFHENHEYYKNPYLVTCVPTSKTSSIRNAAFSFSPQLSSPTRLITADSTDLKRSAIDRQYSQETKLESSVSLPQVLRCNRMAQKAEPLGLAKIEPVAFVSDTTNVLTEAFQQPFKHTKREKARGARVQFAEQALFKVGLNDDRIAETCDSDSDDYVMRTKQKHNMQHHSPNSIDDENESLNSRMNFSGMSSCKTIGSQRGFLDNASVNISLMHKSGGANVKKSGAADSPSALIREFEEKHFSHTSSRNNGI